MPRWASFDCYGTLIDWNGGIRAELARPHSQRLHLSLQPAAPGRPLVAPLTVVLAAPEWR